MYKMALCIEEKFEASFISINGRELPMNRELMIKPSLQD
jgi:hypothetical protein